MPEKPLTPKERVFLGVLGTVICTLAFAAVLLGAMEVLGVH